MTIPPITGVERWSEKDGTLTIEAMIFLQELTKSLTDAEAKLTAIAAVTKPSGGATIDAEARTAIDAIIDGAA